MLALRQAVFNFIMSANPIALVVIGVVALIAIFVLLEKRFGLISGAMQLLSNFFDKFLIEPIQIALNLIGKLISAIGKIPGVGAVGNLVGGVLGKIPGLAMAALSRNRRLP